MCSVSASRRCWPWSTAGLADDDVIADGKTRLAHVDDDGVTFTSHLDGSKHRFTPEVSMRIQHQLGADIIFAFDELTTLMNTRGYQEQSVRAYARLGRALPGRAPPADRRAAGPALPGAVRRGPGRPVRGPAPAGQPGTWPALDVDGRGFDGYGIGGALEKENLGTITGWVCRRAAGGQAPAPARHLRTGRLLHRHRERRRHLRLRLAVPGGPQRGRLHPRRPVQRQHRGLPAGLRARSTPSATATPARTTPGPTCTTCSRPRRCWPRPCAPSTTSGSSSRLVDDIRASIDQGYFDAFRAEFLGRYYARRTVLPG